MRCVVVGLVLAAAAAAAALTAEGVAALCDPTTISPSTIEPKQLRRAALELAGGEGAVSAAELEVRIEKLRMELEARNRSYYEGALNDPPLLDENRRAKLCSSDFSCGLNANPCVFNYCDLSTCICRTRNAFSGASCSDGLFCNGAERCDGRGTCLPSTDPCDGAGQCRDECNEATDSCNSPQGRSCNNNLFCDGANDQCDGSGNCLPTGQGPCANGGPCSSTCNEAQDTCNLPDGTSCDDGVFCNGAEECQGGNCVSSGNPCSGGSECNNVCNEVDDDCFAAANVPCTPDTNPCTNDVCNGAGSCEHPFNTAPCNDGNMCTSNDVCSGGTCTGTFTCMCMVAADCDDNNECTVDTCDAGTCSNTNVANGMSCDDGLFCTGSADTCQNGVCTGSANPCAGGNSCNNQCNEEDQNCFAASGAPCDDNDFCNGVDRCDGAGTCTHAGDPCVGNPLCRSMCNATAGNCFAPATTSCNNGVFCDGPEMCDGQGTCVSGGDPCAGTNPCSNQCNEAEGNCFTPLGTPCDDDIWCNGVDSCDGQGTCSHSGNPCAIRADDVKNSCIRGCIELNRTCATAAGTVVGCFDTANRTDCVDDNFCDGQEECDGFGGIRSPGDPCAARGLTCNIDLGRCDDADGAEADEGDDAVGADGSVLGFAMPIFLGLVAAAVCLCAICLVAVVLVARRRSDRSSQQEADLPGGSIGLRAPSFVGTPNDGASSPAHYGELSANASVANMSPGGGGGQSAGAYGGLGGGSPGASGGGSPGSAAYAVPVGLSSPGSPGAAAAAATAAGSPSSPGGGSNGRLKEMLAASPLGHQSSQWMIEYSEVTFQHEVGKGSFGTVYAGLWRGGQVAVKTIQGNDFDQKELDDFLAEAQVMSGLRPHTNVVQFFGISAGELGVCILTEFLRRGSLDDVLFNPKQVVTPTEQLQWIRGIASGMQHLAAEHVIHRDLAARNVLLGDDAGAVKICDFGLSRQLVGGADQNTTKSDTGPLKHMAPEALLSRQYSVKSDVWAYAITVNEILTRAEPYPGYDAINAATQVTHGLRVEYPQNLDAGLLSLLSQCLSHDPSYRPDFGAIFTHVDSMTALFTS